MTTRTALLSALITAALAVVLGLVVADPYFTAYDSELSGAVVGLQQREGEMPGPSQYIVQLDAGPRVIVGGTGRLPYREGQRVIVREGRSRFFGIRRYRFERFAEKEHHPLEKQNSDASTFPTVNWVGPDSPWADDPVELSRRPATGAPRGR